MIDAILIFVTVMVAITPILLYRPKSKMACQTCGSDIKVTRFVTFNKIETLFKCTKCNFCTLSVEKVNGRS